MAILTSLLFLTSVWIIYADSFPLLQPILIGLRKKHLDFFCFIPSGHSEMISCKTDATPTYFDVPCILFTQHLSHIWLYIMLTTYRVLFITCMECCGNVYMFCVILGLWTIPLNSLNLWTIRIRMQFNYETLLLLNSYSILMSSYSAIIGRKMELFKKHLFKFIWAMPIVSIN